MASMPNADQEPRWPKKMTIANFVEIVPPPREPFEAFEGPWTDVEAELGTALPEDYKAFVRLYGSGYFMEFLGVAVPRSGNPNVRFETQARLISDMFRNHTSLGDEEASFPVWPEAGGLLGFGTTDNGDHLFWLTEGAPDAWKVVVWGRGTQEYQVFDCGLTGFLAGLASGEILPRDFPEDMLPCELLFQPNSAFPAAEGGAS